jgi:RNA polymerase sigma-70 factor (ECF subfamily)
MDAEETVLDERPAAQRVSGVLAAVTPDAPAGGTPTTPSAPSAPSDEMLVAAALRNRDDFAQLYLRYADRVYRFALARTRSATLADDIVSDTMVAVLEGLHTFDARKGSFPGWLFTIASRRIADRDRRQRQFWSFLARRPPGPSDFEQEEDALTSTLRAEQRELVRTAIGRLSETHQQAVLLRYVAELPIRDIGAVLGITEGAVKMRLNRALQHLARELGEDHVEAPTPQALRPR